MSGSGECSDPPPDGIVPGGANSPDLDHSCHPWSALLFFRRMDCCYPFLCKNIPLTLWSSTSAFPVVLLSEHSQAVGLTCNYFRTKAILQIVFSWSSKFSAYTGPPFSTPFSFPALCHVTLQLCLSRGDIYFPTSGVGHPCDLHERMKGM